MKFVNRSAVAVPPSLAGNNSASEKELAKARIHYSASPAKKKTFDFKVYRSHDVRVALRTLFGGVCAYCEFPYEGGAPVDVEHYRPKGGVEEHPQHPGYWWLAMRWDNLLPSCQDCNRGRKHVEAVPGMSFAELQTRFEVNENRLSGKENFFPTENDFWVDPEEDPANERPLLIDPTKDDPTDFLAWYLEDEIPILLPKCDEYGNVNPRGAATISIHGLNRFGLAQTRLFIFRQMRTIVDFIDKELDGFDLVHPQQQQERIGRIRSYVKALKGFTVPGNPHSSMAGAYVNKLKAKWERML